LAFELGWNDWKLAFATAPAGNPRLVSIRARDLKALPLEIAKAKKRFGLPEDAAVVSCYEAGRDGFWLHRYLHSQGIINLVW
jgi:transposase